jgi:hypothetical protein
LHTGWTALGLASAGRNPRDLDRRSRSSIDYISAHLGNVNDVGELERTLLVLRAAGMKPSLRGHSLLARLLMHQRRDGSIDTINHTAFGILALRASGRATHSREVRAAAHYLLGAQNRDGGYGFSEKAASDIDDTGAVLQALAAAGRRGSPAVDRAVRFLRRSQGADGGFAQMPGGDSNAQSTAWAIQGLVAAGRDPRKLRRSRTPIGYLKSLQSGDGSIRYSRTSAQTPIWVTAQALAALEGKPFPLRPAPRHKAHATKPAAKPAAATPIPSHARAKRSVRRAHRRAPRKRAHTATPQRATLGVSVAEIRPAARHVPVAQVHHDGGSGSVGAAVLAALAATLGFFALRRVVPRNRGVTPR